ncbi:hypothetical protein Dimus_021903 [Dionaea muscipula]
MMKRGLPYVDANTNQYNTSQLLPISAQRMHQNSGMKSFPGSRDSFPAEEELPHTSSNTEGQWQWDRDAQQMSPGLQREGQGEISGRSFYPNQISDPKFGSSQEPMVLTHEQDMEIGYEDNPSPKTFEALEQKFRHAFSKLTKEHVDAEDAENDRHGKKIIQINDEYQEKLSALRAQHATRREEFLGTESQMRFQRYHHPRVGINQYEDNTPPSNIGHPGLGGAPPAGVVPAEAQRSYSGSLFDSYRQHPESFGRGRAQGADVRVPAPGYGTGPHYY